MKSEDYIKILDENLQLSAQNLDLGSVNDLNKNLFLIQTTNSSLNSKKYYFEPKIIYIDDVNQIASDPHF